MPSRSDFHTPRSRVHRLAALLALGKCACVLIFGQQAKTLCEFHMPSVLSRFVEGNTHMYIIVLDDELHREDSSKDDRMNIGHHAKYIKTSRSRPGGVWGGRLGTSIGPHPLGKKRGRVKGLVIYIYITDFRFKAKIRYSLPLSDLRGVGPMLV